MIDIVIGANFGDEGKGQIVSALCTDKSLVVRFNGGAQAGHTVVHNGVRHVFSHFGAGMLAGAATLLSRHFIVNPIVYVRERNVLTGKKGLLHPPDVYVDKRALITTPIDMLINQAAEKARANAHGRHGSCGLGINETVVRCGRSVGTMTAFGLKHSTPTQLVTWLQGLTTTYVPGRLVDLSRSIGATVHMPLHLMGDTTELFTRWTEDVEFFLKTTILCDDTDILCNKADHLVFEGAQGLRLDEVYGKAPHVTRSRTGMTNVRELLQEAKNRKHPTPRFHEPRWVYYVTRPYITRHGAGPLDHELVSHPHGWVGHETNVTNEYQGPFRYGVMNPDTLAEFIAMDRGDDAHDEEDPYLVVTCLDQFQGQDAKLVGYETETGHSRVTPIDLPSILADACELPLGAISEGPTTKDVTFYNRPTRVWPPLPPTAVIHA